MLQAVSQLTEHASYVQRLTSQLEGLQAKARQPTKPDKAQKVKALATVACPIPALSLVLIGNLDQVSPTRTFFLLHHI